MGTTGTVTSIDTFDINQTESVRKDGGAARVLEKSEKRRTLDKSPNYLLCI